MPSALRAQVALVALLAVLMIPIATSSLRGLTHILTCREPSATPFSIEVAEDGTATIASSNVIERGADGEITSHEVCGGLVLDLLVGATHDDRADTTLRITNNSDFGWHGSVQLDLGGTAIPIDIGEVDRGGVAEDQFQLRLDRGRRYEIAGSLLVGP